MYVNIFTISVPRWVITNSVSLAPLTQLRSRELTMKYSALVGSAAPCQDPTCPGPSWLGRSPPSWPRARRPSRRRTRTNEQKRNQIFFTIENQDKQTVRCMDSYSNFMQLFEVTFFLLSV